MMREYPGMRALWGGFLRETGMRHADGLTFAALTARLALALHDPSYRDPHHWVNKGRDLIDAIGGDLSDRARFEQAASILANDLGQMRVQFDVHAYRPQPAYRDDNTFLWLFDESEPVAVAQTDGGTAQQIEVAGFDGTGDDDGASPAEQLEQLALHYPEWNYRTEILREDWVRLCEEISLRAVGSDSPGMPIRLTGPRMRRTWQQRCSARRLKRQPEGDALDLDATVDFAVARRGGEVPDGRVFTRNARQPQDASVLLLLDLSVSTERRMRGSSLSLIDLEKQAAEQIIAAFDGAHQRIALHGFSSNGRSEVRYLRIKEFSSTYSEAHRSRLQALAPAGSTRFGAALRHAGRCLATETNSSKTVIIVTDGEPYDIDVFDASYLIEDARHAVDMLVTHGIRSLCINLDENAHARVAQIFGQSCCATVSSGENLGMILERTLAKVAA
jgi:nitric oxide reductase activation protein